jgi:hypothetical protein
MRFLVSCNFIQITHVEKFRFASGFFWIRMCGRRVGLEGEEVGKLLENLDDF